MSLALYATARWVQRLRWLRIHARRTPDCGLGHFAHLQTRQLDLELYCWGSTLGQHVLFGSSRMGSVHAVGPSMTACIKRILWQYSSTVHYPSGAVAACLNEATCT